MNTTKEQRKEFAIKILKQLDIYEPYIQGFQNDDNVCFFERYSGFWVYQEPEVEAKMKEIEKKYNCTVYAITHEFTEFGECYSFLIITDDPEEWDEVIYSSGKQHTVFAYVWNKDDEWCSELGDITVQSFGGGIRRVA